MKHKRNDKAPAITRALSPSITNKGVKSLFTSNSKPPSVNCQPPVKVIWHKEGEISSELKSVLAMLLRGVK